MTRVLYPYTLYSYVFVPRVISAAATPVLKHAQIPLHNQ